MFRRLVRFLRLGGLLKRLAWLILFLICLPYILILIYKPPIIHPVSTLMLADLATSQPYKRQWVDFDKIAPVLVKSVMMSEDGKFCSHNGIDMGELQGVIEDALEGEATRGASTIPMQTVKNLYLWNGRFYIRKLLELPLALAADYVWSKKRIMEIYLNIAQWGPGIYGIEAAARHYFKTSAAKLSSRQAAYLAISLPNPIERVANRPSKGMRRLAIRDQRLARQAGRYIKCLYD